jgi:hypothetical protein
MDLFIKADAANAKATYAALAEFGASLQGIRPDDFTDPNSFFRFGREPKGFDILPAIPGVDFDAAWERRVETTVDTATGSKANFISAEDLIASKLASGRPQDLADADAIRKPAQFLGAAREAQAPQIFAPAVNTACSPGTGNLSSPSSPNPLCNPASP